MCGGQGTRLGAAVEKPLYEIQGTPMIDRVLDALAASRIETTYAVTAPATPETRAHVDVPVIEGSGEGYVADLAVATEQVEPPVLSVGADLPLLTGAAVDWVLDRYDGGSAMVAVPVALKASLGVSIDAQFDYQGEPVAPTGINVVGPPEPEHTIMTEDPTVAVNVNRPRDAWVASVLAGDSDGPR
jgi:adenosylcobinamide-phosphate guanylyltransferase